MAIVVNNTAEERALKYFLGIIPTTEDLELALYVNNYIPTETDDFTDFTEASGFGYTRKDLVSGSWTVTPGNPCQAIHSQVTWTFTGALGYVYGFCVLGKNTGTLYWADKFTPNPFNVQNNGDMVAVTPKINLQ